MKVHSFVMFSMMLSVFVCAQTTLKKGDSLQDMRELFGIETKIVSVELTRDGYLFKSNVHYYDNARLIIISAKRQVCEIIKGSSKRLSGEDSLCDFQKVELQKLSKPNNLKS